MKLRNLILAAVLALGIAPVFSSAAFGQGCAMCYSSAKAASKDGQRAINKGVLVLLVPPVGFMSLGVALAFHYGRRRDREQA